MEMIKSTNWKVRGDLEFNKRISLQGRHYTLEDTEPYVNARGVSGVLLVWRGTCTVCGCKFTFKSTRSTFYPTSRCQDHRPASSRRQ